MCAAHYAISQLFKYSQAIEEHQSQRHQNLTIVVSLRLDEARHKILGSAPKQPMELKFL